MTYNLTNFTDANNFLEIFVASNDLTGGLFMLFGMILIFIVSFTAMKTTDTKDAFLVSSFITLILGITLFGVGLVSETVMVVAFVVFLISIVGMFVTL